MLANKPTAVIAAATKVLRVLYALRGHYLIGLSNKQLAESLNEPPPQITRALQTLEADGWVEKRETGNYAPSLKTVRFAVACQEEYERIEARISEYKQRLERSH